MPENARSRTDVDLADVADATVTQLQSTAYPVFVGVALHRPPMLDQWRKVIVSAASEAEAQLIACQISACTSVMPVCAHIDREGVTA